MERLDLEALVGQIARMLQASLKSDPETGGKVGFCLLMFDFGVEGSFAYAANANRADVVRLLKEAREKIAAATQ
jgi:hypothetical protein